MGQEYGNVNDRLDKLAFEEETWETLIVTNLRFNLLLL